jgi:hypothetical protein
MTEIKWTRLHKVLKEYGDRFIQLAKDKMGMNKSYATGELADTMETVVEINDEYFKVSIKLQDYWYYLENGTKPHFPPLQAIKEWVEVKGITPEERNGYTPSIEQLPYMIQKSIGKYGTEAHPFFNENKEIVYKEFENNIIYAIDEDIAEWVNDNVTEMLKNVFN